MKTLKTLAAACFVAAMFARPALADVSPKPSSKCASAGAEEGALWLGAGLVLAVARRSSRKD